MGHGKSSGLDGRPNYDKAISHQYAATPTEWHADKKYQGGYHRSSKHIG